MALNKSKMILIDFDGTLDDSLPDCHIQSPNLNSVIVSFDELAGLL
jgi:hypothetical protein